MGVQVRLVEVDHGLGDVEQEGKFKDVFQVHLIVHHDVLEGGGGRVKMGEGEDREKEG